MTDVICLGELIVDMISATQDAPVAGAAAFVPTPGGAPANVAVGCVRQGISAAYIGKVGDDAFGDLMMTTMENQGVLTRGIARDKAARTTLNFNARRADGVRECLFYRHPGADMRLSAEDVPEELFPGSGVFHFGSVTLSSPEGICATEKALEYAKKHGLFISYDPNLRLGLWDAPEEEIRRTVSCYLGEADFVKISDDESEFILGTSVPEEICSILFSKGVKLAVVTLGARGCYWSDGKNSGSISVFSTGLPVLDTTGAGDSFVASMVKHLVDRRKSGLPFVADDAFVAACERANRAGYLATTRLGAIPALPTAAELDESYCAFPVGGTK